MGRKTETIKWLKRIHPDTLRLYLQHERMMETPGIRVKKGAWARILDALNAPDYVTCDSLRHFCIGRGYCVPHHSAKRAKRGDGVIDPDAQEMLRRGESGDDLSIEDATDPRPIQCLVTGKQDELPGMTENVMSDANVARNIGRVADAVSNQTKTIRLELYRLNVAIREAFRLPMASTDRQG